MFTDPGIRPSWGMTVCRMPLWNRYATTRSDLTFLTASAAVCYQEGPPNMPTDTSTLPRRALEERDGSTTATRRESPIGTDRRRPTAGLPGRDICSVCCCLRRAGSRLLIPAAARSQRRTAGPPAPSRSRPAFQTVPDLSVSCRGSLMRSWRCPVLREHVAASRSPSRPAISVR